MSRSIYLLSTLGVTDLYAKSFYYSVNSPIFINSKVNIYIRKKP